MMKQSTSYKEKKMVNKKRTKIQKNWLASFISLHTINTLPIIVCIFGACSSLCGADSYGIIAGLSGALMAVMFFIIVTMTTYICAYEERGFRWLLFLLVLAIPFILFKKVSWLQLVPFERKSIILLKDVFWMTSYIYFWISGVLLLIENLIVIKQARKTN